MEFATLDVLDKDLSRDYNDNINLKLEHQYTYFRETVLLNPLCWDKYYEELEKYRFDWKEFKYNDISSRKKSLDDIITETHTGVYLFIVKSNNQINNLPQIVLYVGIAGEDNSDRSLKERLSDYFYISGIKKRKRVHTMLKKYYNNIYIAFSYMKIISTDLEALEKALHGFFYPIYCDRDFPIEIKEIRKSFPR